MSRAPAAPRQPATLKQATALLERYAILAAQIALAEATREKQLADTNAVADAMVTPWLQEQELIRAALDPWWTGGAGAELTKGKRKSLLLAGCTIGTRAASAKVQHRYADEAGAVEALMGRPWARRELIETKYQLRRPDILRALGGKRAAELAELGFSRSPAAETFFVRRDEPSGTVAAVAD